ncbi:hypothetical protein ANCDUO_16151 [Ancylostoma duodenale]|uniref:Uncharacterized protein n=1 Tax=Ancylostoma duodenale TaxID=51022 RepID=A0A0C2CV44_9BILA|nr:hypothetical protein ANCDUO_16151 [Ancylostoma duodenale]
MNLREFLSNDEEFNSTISQEDHTKNSCPEVLGIPWNSKSVTIILSGKMAPNHGITKRTVSQQLASAYDPLGFLVPVLLPAKVFLQSLWKDEYGWDTELPPNLQEQWRIISSEISTFYSEIKRQAFERETLAQSTSSQTLANLQWQPVSTSAARTRPTL